ncbi:MAG: hypothetical protein R2764_16105 [Bacteroidales bacterium]
MNECYYDLMVQGNSASMMRWFVVGDFSLRSKWQEGQGWGVKRGMVFFDWIAAFLGTLGEWC